MKETFYETEGDCRMNERIALGFHTCVDYELKWDTQVVEEQIKHLIFMRMS